MEHTRSGPAWLSSLQWSQRLRTQAHKVIETSALLRAEAARLQEEFAQLLEELALLREEAALLRGNDGGASTLSP
jgi:hypothetical protein